MRGRLLGERLLDLVARPGTLDEPSALQRRLDSRSPALKESRRDAEQLMTTLRALCARHGYLEPLPPRELRLHVGARASEANFLAQGVASSNRVLRLFGEEPDAPILDWGSGSGRTVRWLWSYPAWRRWYHGCDVDADAVEWLRSVGVSSVEVCGDLPPLPYPDASFGGLFAFSVLTHIHPARHRLWYGELARVLRPGGRAFLTTQGDVVVADATSGMPVERQAYEDKGWAYLACTGHYKDAALVSEAFTREALDGVFELCWYEAGGYANMEAFLVEKPE